MSLGRCLTDLVATQKISQAQADKMQPVYDELLAQFEPRFGRAAAESMATEKAMKAIEDDFLIRKANTLRQVKAQATIIDNASRLYRGKSEPGKPSPAGLIAHLVDDGKAPYGNVEYRWKSIRDEAHRMMYDVLYKHRANALGEARHASDFEDVVRALDDPKFDSLNAREMADAWTRTAEFLRTAFNAAGGAIGKLEGWSLPHHWDGIRTALKSFDDWRSDMSGALDRSKMIDRNTGEPMSDFALDDVLRQVHDSITTEGAAGRDASGAIGGKSIANRRQDHRVLHFRDADAWLAMNEKYGSGDPYSAMLHHIDGMSRDIAAMQILGPNPAATVRWMQELIGKTALTSSSLRARLQGGVYHKRLVDGIWNQISGANNVAAKPNAALFFSTVRNWQAASKLGSATLASMPDLATQALTTRFNGLPAVKAIGHFVKGFNPADASHRDFARRALMIQDEFIGRSAGFGRQHFEDYQGGALTAPTIAALRDGRIGVGDFAYLQLNDKLRMANEISRRASNLTLRASLLNQWTMQMRHVTNMEFWNGITHYAATPFDQLDGRFRGFLQRYGVNADEWAGIGATPRTEFNGTHWILPDQIGDRALRQKLVEGVMTELDYAVSTGGIRQHALMTAGGRPGEMPYEIVKTAGQFLMFPITVTARHASRALGMSTVGTKAGYASAFLIATTLMGAVSEQLNNVAAGKDPRPMDNEAFWAKAFSRGGGLGYYQTIIEHTVAENGRGLSDIGNVPTLGGLADAANLAVRQPFLATGLSKKADGEAREPNFAKAGTRWLKNDMAGSNIWWLKLGYQRLLLDSLDEMGGDHPGEAARRLEQRAQEEGTQYFARPGTGPSEWRAPNMANAWGNEQAERGQ